MNFFGKRSSLCAAGQSDRFGEYRGIDRGVVIQCADGYCIAGSPNATVYDQSGEQIKQIRATLNSRDVQTRHVASFVDAVRSRDAAQLSAEAMEGHLSAACCHMANISHRLGHSQDPDAALDAVRAKPEMANAFERCREYLKANGVDLATSHAAVGPWVTLDAEQWQFVGEFAGKANALSRREYRKPFVVPQLTS